MSHGAGINGEPTMAQRIAAALGSKPHVRTPSGQTIALRDEEVGASAFGDASLKSSGVIHPVSGAVPLEPAPRAGRYRGLLSGAAYCAASTCMLLMNKQVLSAFKFKSTNSLLLLQTLMCITLVKLCEALKLIRRLEKFSWPVARTWLPVNVIFVGMIWTGFFSLKALSVPMVTVLKNVTNLIVVFGDIFIFNKRHSLGVWLSLLFMLISALCGGYTDLYFDPAGYFWQLLNCFFTAAYSLSLRFVMDKVKEVTKNPKGLDEFSMVLYNNILSIPLVLILMIIFGELPQVFSEPALQDPRFLAAAMVSGVLSFGISFATLWFLHESSATTYSLVGSLNKIPTAAFGAFFFPQQDTSWANVASIMVGLLAAVAFTRAKIAEADRINRK